MRPREYLQLIANAIEAKKKREQKQEILKRSSTRMAISVASPQSNEELKDGTPKDSELKSKPPIELPPLNIEVVKMMERDETPEETQKRLALAEEEKKKAGKKRPAGKPKPEDQEPKKVKEAVLGDLSLALPLPKYSRWVTSQIQFIKDRNIVDSYVVVFVRVID